MRFILIALAGALVGSPVALAQAPEALHLTYTTYAAGLHVAAVRADLMFGPYQYQVRVAYHTTGLIGFFDSGRESSAVDGIWYAGRPEPREFSSLGVWHGKKHATLIDYRGSDPLVKTLLPPDRNREPVPPALQDHTLDTLSALALLMRQAAATRQCDASVRTYDGRRVVQLTAHGVGWEKLPRTDRSTYSGPALRCDFASRVLAGFKRGTDAKDQPPLHGTIWFAAALPGEPPVPVRLRFETAWFGDATTYLTDVKAEVAPQVAQQH